MTTRQPSIVCVGGATVDRAYRACAPLVPRTSNPVSAAGSGFGGVARNVAETLARLGIATGLVSVVGDDDAGRALSSELRALGVLTRVTVAAGSRTAEYLAVLQPTGELAFGLADMAVLDEFTPALIDQAWPLLAQAGWVFADCNLPSAALARLVERRRARGAFKLAVDAVSTAKARRLPSALDGVDLLFANLEEACVLAGAEGSADAAELARSILDHGAGAVVVTLGARGALAAKRAGRITLLPAVAAEVVDVTGAGDALIAGTLSRLLKAAPLAAALRTGLAAAALAIESRGSVRPDLTPDLLAAAGRRIQAPSNRERAP